MVRTALRLVGLALIETPRELRLELASGFSTPPGCSLHEGHAVALPPQPPVEEPFAGLIATVREDSPTPIVV